MKNAKNVHRPAISMLYDNWLFAFIGFLVYYPMQLARYSLGAWITQRMRWRAAHWGVESAFVQGLSRVYSPENLEVGSYCHFMNGCHWSCQGGLTIGNHVIMSRNVTIYTHNHDYEGNALPYEAGKEVLKPVVIYDNVWIGMNVTILPGTIIHEGCIIGAGAVLYGEITPLSIIGSSGYRHLKYRDMLHYVQKASEQAVAIKKR